MTDNTELTDIFNAAIAAVDPYRAVLNAVRLEQSCLHVAGAVYDLDGYRRIVVVGAGKATARMALAIESLLGQRIDAGLIIVKNGHSAAFVSGNSLERNPSRPPLDRGGREGLEPVEQSGLNIIKQIEASHPVPDQAGVDATQEILHMARQADEHTLFICLISGGASALLVAPVAGVTLVDKQEVTNLLLKAGTSIEELNAVRKHLSLVKGGRLAQAAFPAQVVTLILSDVIGDRLDVIASGPTAADVSTFAGAWAVIEKYRLQNKIPARVSQHLQQGLAGIAAETIRQDDECMCKVHNVIVGGLGVALHAAMEKSRQFGLHAEIIKTDLQGEAREAVHYLAHTARAALKQMQPDERRILLSGGETTVTVKGTGMGGRNQELALAFALDIEGQEGVSLLSAGTDGSDGPNDAAGALVNGHTASRARQLGIDAVEYLADNDSYHFFGKYDAETGEHTHFVTGPTGTNVMDLQIMLLQNTHKIC